MESKTIHSSQHNTEEEWRRGQGRKGQGRKGGERGDGEGGGEE
jgi:hypothetical protein